MQKIEDFRNTILKVGIYGNCNQIYFLNKKENVHLFKFKHCVYQNRHFLEPTKYKKRLN